LIEEYVAMEGNTAPPRLNRSSVCLILFLYFFIQWFWYLFRDTFKDKNKDSNLFLKTKVKTDLTFFFGIIKIRFKYYFRLCVSLCFFCFSPYIFFLLQISPYIFKSFGFNPLKQIRRKIRKKPANFSIRDKSKKYLHICFLQQKKTQGLKPKIYELTGTKMMFKPFLIII
jgi:hypothetical protein